MNIRLKTCLIIRRGPEYLVGRILDSTEYRWSSSPWDAWKTRKWEKAQRIGRRTGGELWLFNTVTGEIREARYGKSGTGGGNPDWRKAGLHADSASPAAENP